MTSISFRTKFSAIKAEVFTRDKLQNMVEVVSNLKFAKLVLGIHVVKVPGGGRAGGLHAGRVGGGAGRGEVVLLFPDLASIP